MYDSASDLTERPVDYSHPEGLSTREDRSTRYVRSIFQLDAAEKAPS